jgi:hypothetical protein
MTRVDQHCEPWKMKPWNEPSHKKKRFIIQKCELKQKPPQQIWHPIQPSP